MAIPGGYVPKDYSPSNAEVVLAGHFLKPGMIVLLRDGRKRGDPHSRAKHAHSQEWLDVKARWCRIESLTPAAPRGSTVTFTGVYADGTRHERRTTTLASWIVKQSSRPK